MPNDERQLLKARRADKRRRYEDLRLRISSQLVSLRRELGGGYVESLSEIKLSRADTTFQDLKSSIREARQVETAIEKLTERIGD